MALPGPHHFCNFEAVARFCHSAPLSWRHCFSATETSYTVQGPSGRRLQHVIAAPGDSPRRRGVPSIRKRVRGRVPAPHYRAKLGLVARRRHVPRIAQSSTRFELQLLCNSRPRRRWMSSVSKMQLQRAGSGPVCRPQRAPSVCIELNKPKWRL